MKKMMMKRVKWENHIHDFYFDDPYGDGYDVYGMPHRGLMTVAGNDGGLSRVAGRLWGHREHST